MPDLGFPVVAIAVVIVIIYLLSSIKILAEYERGVIFRLGRLLGTAKGPGVILVFAPIDRMVRISLRQEALEVPPQDIITRDNVTLKVNAVIFLRVIDPEQSGGRSFELRLPDFAVCADDAALGARRTGARRIAGASRQDQPAPAEHPRHAHRALGREGGERGSEAGGYAGVDAARDGQAGRGGTRKAVEDHPRRRRVLGRAATGGCRASVVHRTGQHPVALFADADGNRGREKYDGRVPGADRFLLGHAEVACAASPRSGRAGSES